MHCIWLHVASVACRIVSLYYLLVELGETCTNQGNDQNPWSHTHVRCVPSSLEGQGVQDQGMSHQWDMQWFAEESDALPTSCKPDAQPICCNL